MTRNLSDLIGFVFMHCVGGGGLLVGEKGMRKPDTYIKSQRFILNQLLSFPTISNKDWQSCDFNGVKPQEGDLVSLQSAPAAITGHIYKGDAG